VADGIGAHLAEDSAAVNDPAVSEAAPGDRGACGARRKAPRLASIGGIALAALVIAAVVVLSSGSSHRSSRGTGIPAGDTTATVTRRTLTESATLDGTLGYGASLELYDRLSESGTFTWLPSVGAVIARGGTLFKVNNLPVVLMYGSTPAYRTLKKGVGNGPDVTELNRNLVDLGFDGNGAIADFEKFSEATATAVRRWQKAEGLPQTGEVELGRVIFATSAQRVTKLHVSLGQDPPGATEPTAEGSSSREPASAGEEKEPTSKGKDPEEGSSSKPSTKASKEPSAGEKGSAKREPSKKSGSKQKPSKGHPSKEGSKNPAQEEKAPNTSTSKAASSDSGEHPSGKGGEGGAGTVVLSTTSNQQIVALQVKADQQQLAHVGEPAPVKLPDGDVVGGRITSVGTVATESSESEKGGGDGGGGEKGGGSAPGNGESATIAVTIVLDHRVAHLDAAPVSVELVKESRRDVLAVPATSLIGTAGGGYALQTLEDNRRADVPVTPGMFANGYVQVEGTGVREGLTVLESQ
jgi:peptidoglycan hydrolase-like protein with peptidoglycan-binding domain